MGKTISFTLPGESFCHSDLTGLIGLGVTLGGMFARAEFSGSEGCYVEVAGWNQHSGAWERIAYTKVFEDEIMDGMNAEEGAQSIAAVINGRMAKHGGSSLPFIANLPNFTSPIPK